ncbi:homoprotocatechuate degradation operon regulator HpaR [Aquamicrobium sp. NLF2-7]|uniref:homoprotocatechuate degradation operon regulator HpaR n=1 Tax=Aquamicrobium sp. NLF2-7 TaxID=2918753 RepID=UPI001EFB3DDF|nr:homoprotocatechuate degradation operon regulator HpaR [Aquamicrobium sp. NLF2-7]MCG8273314.1 homoprotocatechuate degradation operon regulator HpaR [Aquamicrobium sp. NLF2-7]
MKRRQCLSDAGKAAGSESPPAQDLRDFSMSLPMSLMRAREAVMRHFRMSLREHHVTEQQWRVIRAISSAGELDVNELVRQTFLLGPSLSRILRTLEASGHISRRTDEDDQRRSVLSLTAKGRELIREHTPQSAQIYQRITEAYGEERLQLLQSMLAELETSMNSFNIVPDTDEDADFR